MKRIEKFEPKINLSLDTALAAVPAQRVKAREGCQVPVTHHVSGLLVIVATLIPLFSNMKDIHSCHWSVNANPGFLLAEMGEFPQI